MKKIDVLVTGGAGYIGSHTLVELHNSGYRPIIVDNLSNTSLANIKGAEEIIKNKITFYEFDCSNENQMNYWENQSEKYPDIPNFETFHISKGPATIGDDDQLSWQFDDTGIIPEPKLASETEETNTLFKLGTEFQSERKRTITNPKKPSIPPGNELAKWISREIPRIFNLIFKNELENYQVHASAGDGQWVSAPWIAILHPKVCLQPNGRISPQCGYYPVYAVSKNEKLIMFALGQGEYNVRLNFPKDVDHKLVDGAINLRKKIPEHKKFFSNVSKTVLENKNKKSERWAKSTAFGKIYKIKNLPSEDILKKDLIDMMKMYQIAIERGGVSESVSQNISFDQDQLSTGYEKKIIKHILYIDEFKISS